MITIQVESAGFLHQLGAVLAATQRPRAVLQAAARSVRRDLQRHFRGREQTPNALGGKRTHWWARVARSTQIASVTEHEAVVSVSEPGFGTKVTGGTIRPVEASALTIPIHPEAHGRRARALEIITGAKLFVFKPKKTGPAFLARSTGDDTLRLLYVLKAVAQVKADPQALPGREALESGALAAARAQLQSELTRRGTAPLV